MKTLLAASILLPVLLAALVAAAPPPSARSLADEARAAYRAKDYETAYRKSSEALALRPGRASFELNVAYAASRTGRFRESAAALVRLLDRGIDFGVEESGELAALRSSPEYAAVKAALAKMSARPPVARARLEFTLPEKDLLTEGIAFDPSTGDLFVSSVHRRKIVRRRPDGAVSDFFDASAGAWGVLALRVDPERRVLWAATAAVPQMQGFESALEGKSRVDAYDLKTGKLLRRVDLPGAGPHVANDLALDGAGGIFVSDSVDSAIYRILPGAESADVFVAPGTFRSPQGMAVTPDGKALLVADYGSGISRIDIASKKVEDVAAPDSIFLTGLDGLDRSGDSLFVTQNLARPPRVVRLKLDAAGRRIVASETLEWNDPRVSEPTLGVVAKGRFYFVGNAQWSRFDEETGAPDTAKLEEPAIYSVPAD